jgi:hypothetical protein
VLHVLAVEEQRPSRIVPSADGDVDVRVRRVPVVDGHPFEPRPEVAFDRVQYAPRVLHQVERVAALGREDHLPEPRILGSLPAVEPPVDLDLGAPGVEAEALLTLSLGALAGQVAAVGPPAAGRAVGRVLDLYDAALLPRAGAVAGALECAPLRAGAGRTLPRASRELAEQQAPTFTALGADAARAYASRPPHGLVAVVAHARWRLMTERRSDARIVSIAGKLRGEAYQWNPGVKCASTRSNRSLTTGCFILAVSAVCRRNRDHRGVDFSRGRRHKFRAALRDST